MIAASYARTSNESGDSVSISSQHKANQKFADSIGLTIGYTFDEEFTGTKIVRPKLDEVMKLIAQGKIDSIIVYDSTRLARSEYVAQYLFNEIFVPNGIRLFIASGNKEIDPASPESLMMWSIENVFSAYERNKIVERFARAKKTMREEGLWVGEGGIATYGYKKVGSKKDSRIELIQEEYTVVIKIFELFLQGHSTLEIAGILNTADITPPAGKGYFPFHAISKSTWSDNAVYHILKNEKYTGRWYANRWKGNKERDKSEWVRIDLPHTRLISDETFAIAQSRLVENRRKAGADVVHEYLLARRCKCGICGYTINSYTATRGSKKYSYYSCNGRRKRARLFNSVDCNLPPMQSKHVDALLWESLTRFITDPVYREETLDYALQQQREKHKDAIEMIEAVDRAKARFKDEILRLTTLFTEGDIGRDIFRAKKKELEDKYSAALTVENEYTDTLQGVLSSNDIDRINEHMDALATEFQKLGDLPYHRRVELIEAMDITGTFIVEGGITYLDIYVYNTAIMNIPVFNPSDGTSKPSEGSPSLVFLFRVKVA